MPITPSFNPDCVRCPRIADNLRTIKHAYPDYHARPVPPFGDPCARLLVVGLGPGMHGANATGRPFTGDHAGILLYRTLYRHGFSNRPESLDCNDGLELYNCRITNAVKCLPPANKPLTSEIKNCNAYLGAELAGLSQATVVLALGRIAHEAVVRAMGLKQRAYPFAHNALHQLPQGHQLLDSYHCSRYNTQTRRLTVAMFDQVFEKAVSLIDAT